MIDPQFFQERSLHLQVRDWLYENGFIEWRNHELRLSDKAACYLMAGIFLIGLPFVV